MYYVSMYGETVSVCVCECVCGSYDEQQIINEWKSKRLYI